MGSNAFPLNYEIHLFFDVREERASIDRIESILTVRGPAGATVEFSTDGRFMAETIDEFEQRMQRFALLKVLEMMGSAWTDHNQPVSDKE